MHDNQLYRALIAGIFFTAVLGGQTRVRPANLAGETSTAGRVWIVLPSGTIAEADLVNIVLDLSGPRPVLRAAVAVAVAAVDRVVKLKLPVDAGVNAFQWPDVPLPESLAVYRNGLLLADIEDYIVAADGKSLTFVVPGPLKGDIIQVRYRK